MLGEHRPALGDLLWERAQIIIKSVATAGESAADEEEKQTQPPKYSEEEIIII